MTAHLFPVLHTRLIELLAALEPDEWALPTVAGTWTVKEVAAHLLDTQERIVARIRGESASGSPAIASPAELAAFINRINAEGVARYRQLDPAALIALMDERAAEFAAHFQSLDPSGVAPFGVSWAGEETSTNGFHTAREYTERWHHQQQIRLATSRPGIMTRELYHPVLDCFMRALPFSYREKTAACRAPSRASRSRAIAADLVAPSRRRRLAARRFRQPSGVGLGDHRSLRRSPGGCSPKASAAMRRAARSESAATWSSACTCSRPSRSWRSVSGTALSSADGP